MQIKFNEKISLTSNDLNFINEISEEINFEPLDHYRGPKDSLRTYRNLLLEKFIKYFPEYEEKFNRVKKIILYYDPPQIQFRTIS